MDEERAAQQSQGGQSGSSRVDQRLIPPRRNVPRLVLVLLALAVVLVGYGILRHLRIARARSDFFEAVGTGDLAQVKALLKLYPDFVFSTDKKALAPWYVHNYDGPGPRPWEKKDGWTPLHVAADKGRGDFVELLLENKADVNAKALDDWTPLHRAVLRWNKDVVELLLASKADVNAKDDLGLTPLHLAIHAGVKDMVEVLLAKGADVNAKDIVGETPLRLALKKENKDVAELLRQHGGKE